MPVLIKHRTFVTYTAKGDGELVFPAPEGVDYIEEVLIEGRKLDRGLGFTVQGAASPEYVRLTVVPKAGESIHIVGIVWQKPSGRSA